MENRQVHGDVFALRIFVSSSSMSSTPHRLLGRCAERMTILAASSSTMEGAGRLLSRVKARIREDIAEQRRRQA